MDNERPKNVLIENTRQKALNLSSDNKTGGILLKTLDIVQILIKETANHEKLELTLSSFETDRHLTKTRDIESDSTLRSLGIGLTDCAEITMQWIVERENLRENLRTMKSAKGANFFQNPDGDYLSLPFLSHVKIEPFDHMSVSDDEEIEKSKSTDIDEHISEVEDHSSIKSEKMKEDTTDLEQNSARKFQCNLCEKSYDKIWTLNIHIKSKHQKPTKKCTKCDKLFPTTSQVNSHMRTHWASDDPRRKEFPCDICGQYQYDKSTLKAHKKSHLDDNDPKQAEEKRPHKCKECGKSFGFLKYLRKHVRILHADNNDENGEEKEQCDVCGQIFKWKGSLYLHKKLHIEDDELRRPFKCDQCGKKYTKVHHLERHAALHLPDSDPRKLSECDICGKMILTCNFNLHKKVHLEPEKKFKCHICGHSFRMKGGLTLHMNTHTGNFSLKCEICHNGFNSKTSLAFHRDNSCKTKLCNLCPRRFKTDDLLKKHLNMHQKGKVKKGRSDPKRERKYACPECGKMFKHSEHVKIHQMEHLDGIENQKPFKCDMCDMRFRRESERKFHKKVKHSEALFIHDNSESSLTGIKEGEGGSDEYNSDEYEEADENEDEEEEEEEIDEEKYRE